MARKIPIAVIGGTGYTGQELLRLLAQHPSIDLIAVTSETFAGKTLGEAFPGLTSHRALKLESFHPHQNIIWNRVPRLPCWVALSF